jgi:molybdopterin converting factor small subunit
MPTVKFTSALERFFPKIKDIPVSGSSLQEIFKEIESNYPGLSSYVLDERGSLRQHVNIFIDRKMINDRTQLSDSFSSNSEIYIIQALSGG